MTKGLWSHHDRKTEDSQYDYADLVRFRLHCEDIQNTDIQSKQEINGK